MGKVKGFRKNILWKYLKNEKEQLRRGTRGEAYLDNATGLCYNVFIMVNQERRYQMERAHKTNISGSIDRKSEMR